MTSLIITSLFGILVLVLFTVGNMQKHAFLPAFGIAIIETIVLSGAIHLAKQWAFVS